MANPVDLTIHVSADTADAAASFDAVGAAARDMAADVDRAGTDMETASSHFDSVGSAADEAATKTGVMTGALGALAGGLEAVGLEKYGAALQVAAVGTDVMSGASDILALAMESQAIQSVIATAKTIALGVAQGAAAVATGVLTAAQTALNVVMSANPIALVVIALVALVAGLVLAYQKSETFRDIVDALGDTAKTVFGAIGGFIGDVATKAAGIVGTVKGAFEDMFKPLDTAIGWIKDFTLSALTGAVSGAVSSVSGWFTSMFAPIQTAIGWVQDLIDKISNIPDLGDLNPFGRILPGIGGFGEPAFGGLPGQPFDKWGNQNPAWTAISLTVNGAVDPVNTARQIKKILSDENSLYGAGSWGGI